MFSFKDKSFCGSPNCTNECGRKMTQQEHEELIRANQPDQWDGMLGVSYGYFCDKPIGDKPNE